LKKLFSNQRVCAGADYLRSIPLCYNIGRAAVSYLSLKNAPFIIVARDCKSSTEILQLSIADAVCALGGEVLLLDNMTASSAAVLLKKYRADFMLFLYAEDDADAGSGYGARVGENDVRGADGFSPAPNNAVNANDAEGGEGCVDGNAFQGSAGGCFNFIAAVASAATGAGANIAYVIPKSSAVSASRASASAPDVSAASAAICAGEIFVEFFDHTGYNVGTRGEKKIEQIIDADSFYADISADKNEDESPSREGAIYSRHDAYIDYCDFILANIPIENTAQKIVVECGFDCPSAPYIFERLAKGARFYNDFSDIRPFLNDGERISILSKRVLQNGADIGIGFCRAGNAGNAGGACIIIDEKGAVVDNGIVFYLFLKELAAEQKLKQNAGAQDRASIVAASPELNLAVVKALGELNIGVYKTDGSRAGTIKEMVENDIAYGYDSLGRIYFGELFTGCDCIFCAANLCRLINESGKALSALCRTITLKPAKSLHIFAAEGSLNRLTEDELIKQTINLYNYKLSGEGEVVLLRQGSKAVKITAQGEKCCETLAKLKALVTQRLNKNI
jgi:phosphomannomutase